MSLSPGSGEVVIALSPLGHQVRGTEGNTIISVLTKGGLSVAGSCGGRGSCGKCRFQVLEGSTSAPTAAESELLTVDELRKGWRLACQSRVLGDLVIYLPATFLPGERRLMTDGLWEAPELDPPVKVSPTISERPSIGSVARSQLEGLLTMPAPGEGVWGADLEGLREASIRLRCGEERIRPVIRRGELLGVTRPGAGALGVAVDLGTSKAAVFVHDLATGNTIASRGFPNPQAPYGEDVVTRLQHAMQDAESRRRLADLVRREIDRALAKMLSGTGNSPGDVFELVLVGNTAMHHLFLDLPVEGLAYNPYLPVTHLPLEVKARELGFSLHPAAVVYLPPPIDGYVGSDHLAAIAATRLVERDGPCLLLDIGTNTEVSLQVGGEVLCCSCASGPAFEGMGLAQGMPAWEGAVERVKIGPAGKLEIATIGDAAPVGICGSGILSALSALLELRAMEESGRLRPDHPGVANKDGEAVYYLVPPGEGGEGGVAVTQTDIREIQKAKGAIRAGVEALLAEAGISHSEVKEVLLAGAFGTYLEPLDLLSIAMLPPFPPQRIRQVGNAAGAGARSMLLSEDFRRRAEELAGKLRYLELSAYPSLARLFAASMYLSEEAVTRAQARLRV